MPSQRQQVYTRDLNKKEPLKQRDTQIVEYEHFQVVEHLVRTDPQLQQSFDSSHPVEQILRTLFEDRIFRQ